MATITARLTRGQAAALIRQLPQILAGKLPDPTGEVRNLSLVAGVTALSLIKSAYVVKARGGTDEAGEKWEPLAPSTLARRRGGGGGGSVEILRDKGLLFNSLGPAAVRAEPGAIIIGTNVPIARYHHRGTQRMPRRRLWPPTSRWPNAWKSLIARKVREGILLLVQRLTGG